MLASLFGEFGPRRLPTEAGQSAAVAVQIDDSDVLVDIDAAQTMRQHFGTTRSDLEQASSMITLLDPAGIWAPQVIRALSEASGQRVERLNLRERATLRTLAVIERTSVPRLAGGPLKVYHADNRSSDGLPQPLSEALAEGSHLVAVIIGALPPHAVTVVLRNLLAATRQPEWHCPWLVFILPPGANAMRQRILEQDWPARVRTAAMSESLTGPASVWNAVLTAWEAAASASGRPVGTVAVAGDLAPPQWLAHALAPVANTEGVVACGIVDLDCGELLSFDADARLQPELRQLAQALCAARRAHRAAGGPEVAAPEEMLVTMGPRQGVLRPISGSETLGFVALLDRARANLPLLRYRLKDAERQVG